MITCHSRCMLPWNIPNALNSKPNDWNPCAETLKIKNNILRTERTKKPYFWQPLSAVCPCSFTDTHDFDEVMKTIWSHNALVGSLQTRNSQTAHSDYSSSDCATSFRSDDRGNLFYSTLLKEVNTEIVLCKYIHFTEYVSVNAKNKFWCIAKWPSEAINLHHFDINTASSPQFISQNKS